MPMLLNVLGGVSLTATLLVMVSTVVLSLNLSIGGRVAVAAAIGGWAGLQLALAAGGAVGIMVGGAPLIGLMAATPVLLVAVLAATSSQVRRQLIGIPIDRIAALNLARAIGIFFLLLAAAGRMTGPFPYVAGWGDVITAFEALLVVLSFARGRQASSALWVWTLFGMLDLVIALTLGGITFGAGIPPLLPAAIGGSEVASVPWVLIPTTLVPMYLILHGVVFARLRLGTVTSRIPEAAAA
jgi:hypothetical protein